MKLIPELVPNRYALATREEFELAVAIALQEMRHVGTVSLPDLAGADAFDASFVSSVATTDTLEG